MMLDIKTLMLLFLITNVINAGAVAVVILSQDRRRLPGIFFLLVMMGLQVFGATMHVLRGLVPDLISMTLANAVILTGIVIILLGLERFTGERGRQVHNYVLLALFIAVSAYFVVVQPNLMARDIALSAMIMIFTFQCSWLLLRRAAPGLRQITRLTGIVFAVYAAFSFAKIILTVIFPEQSSDFYKSGAVNALAITGYITLNICLAISLVLMVNRRLLVDIGAQEEKFNTAFHSSPYAITLTKLSDGRIFEVNDGFVNITGYQYAEVIGKTTLDLHLWVNEEDRRAVINELAQGHDIQGVEYQFRDKTAKVFTGILSASLVTINNETCILSSINDITERKRAEAALWESEKYFKEITENSSDMIIITDKNGDIKYCSRSVERFTGYKPEELIGRSGFTFIHPDDVERAVTDFGKAILTTDSAIPNAFRMVHKDGSERYCDGQGKNLLDNPAIAGFVMNIRDITEHKQAEEDFKKAEENYRNIFENAIEGIFQTTPDGRYLAVNTAQAHMLGYNSPEELIKSVNDINTQVYVKKEFRDYFLRILKERGFIRGYEVEFFKKDGSTIWVSSNARTVRDENGKTVYYEGFNVDVTERKQVEEELRIYQKELQALAIRLSVVEETERKEIARTLHDLVGQNLTALNLNLNIIFGMMTEDQKSLFSSRLEDSQKLLEETTQHIREVMSDLRPSVLDDFGLLAALHWYGQQFQGRTGIQTNIKGEEFYPRLSSVMETIIFRITQEVLTNVFKHASASRVNLRLGKTENMVQLTIKDNGKGFRFEGFRFGGEKRGWGIVTMKERAVALRGDLQVFSEPDKGTRVILQLPVA
ncbi:MAG: PAS domain S-box protein [Thermodesulfobacteriota bacterium]|jgi:PAS domain S-box-containing protein